MKTATALASPKDLADDLKRASTRPASVELTPRSTETVNCYLCGSSERTELLLAEDDLTRQARTVPVRDVCAVRARVSEPAPHPRVAWPSSTTTATSRIGRDATGAS